MVYDLIIVGSGMIGSAAAYHASRLKGNSVCLIGPPEPKCREKHKVFGAWYDEGRICRQASNDHTWSVLAVESMKTYKQLEVESGMEFYNESGFAMIMNDTNIYDHVLSIVKKCGLETEDVSGNWKNHFPFFNLPDGARFLWERKNAGYVNPRKMIKASQKVATQNGVNVVEDVVSTITPASSPTHRYRWEVTTEGGSVFSTKSVIVAAGAFAKFNNLFAHVAPGRIPDLDLVTQTIAFLRIPLEEVERLKSMPSVVTRCSFGSLDGAYILPPIQYPDGYWYLKLGHGRAYESKKQTHDEVVSWFRQQTGIPECVDQLGLFLRNMIPGLRVESVSGDGCVTAHTPNSEPYIDMVGEGFGVALGGNGYAAKSCLEIGRLAAHMVLLEEWNSEIPKDRVRMKWKESSKL